jgi:ubiquinone/menaquinone biosynthesis C-methylase UbiE
MCGPYHGKGSPTGQAVLEARRVIIRKTAVYWAKSDRQPGDSCREEAPAVNLNLIHHFDKRAASFDDAEWVRDPDLLSALLDFWKPAVHQRVLDIGAGTGAALSAGLAACPGLGACVALDFSREMLARISDPRIKTCCNDATSLPFGDGSFDVALCRQMLHYVDDLDLCLREIHRALAPGGALVICQTTPFGDADESWWKTIVTARQPLRRHFLTLNEMLALLIRNFFVVVRTSQVRSTESLNTWLARYERSAEQIAEVHRLHEQAPESYRNIHRFRNVNNDILVDNCWTLIRVGKSRLPSPAISAMMETTRTAQKHD